MNERSLASRWRWLEQVAVSTGPLIPPVKQRAQDLHRPQRSDPNDRRPRQLSVATWCSPLQEPAWSGHRHPQADRLAGPRA